VRSDVRVERDLVVSMAAPPETMTIAGLVDGDTVNPGSQARLATEPVDGSKDSKKDFLGKVQGLFAKLISSTKKIPTYPIFRSSLLWLAISLSKRRLGYWRCTAWFEASRRAITW